MLNHVRVTAEDSASAMEKITRELGADARIISTRTLGSGVEIVACPPMDFASHLKQQTASSTTKRTSRRMEEFAALLDDARQANQPKMRRPDPSKASIASGHDDQRLAALEGSIAEIKAMLGSELMSNGLMAAGASPALISIFLAQANAIEGPRSDRNFAAFLASRLIHKDQPNLCGGQRIVVALGPSGSGKTTMLAQLAAKIRLENSEARVAFVNADTRRLAASEQLQAYGRIMDVPVVDIEKVRELSGFVRNADSQLTMLVDMPSGAADCETLMQELNGQSNELAPITRIGVIASTLSAESITQMFDAYPDIDAIALTKLNEARVTLTAISQLSMRRTPIAYLSTDSHLMRGLTEADASSIERLIRGSLPGIRRESAA